LLSAKILSSFAANSFNFEVREKILRVLMSALNDKFYDREIYYLTGGRDTLGTVTLDSESTLKKEIYHILTKLIGIGV
jgi:hypothetical protein